MNFVMKMIFSSRSCYLLEPSQVGKGMIVTCAAHLKRGAQVVAHDWPIWLAENSAAVISRKLRATYTCRFAVGHARNGR
jgi:hypothetical protein